MATNIPPHNLGEVCGAIECLIDNPQAELEDLMEHTKGPDFPTGGIIMGRSGIRAAYATGRGKIIVRGKAEIEETKNGKFRIVITEIPYKVRKKDLVKHINHIRDLIGIDYIGLGSDFDGISNKDLELKKQKAHFIIDNSKDLCYTYKQVDEVVHKILEMRK